MRRIAIAFLIVSAGCTKKLEGTAGVGPKCEELEHAPDESLATLVARALSSPVMVGGHKPLPGSLTDSQRALVATRLFETQINHGGFARFFLSDGDQQLAETRRGLELYGATEQEALLEAAVALRASAGDAADYKALDERFFKLSLEKNHARHIRTNLRMYCREQ